MSVDTEYPYMSALQAREISDQYRLANGEQQSQEERALLFTAIHEAASKGWRSLAWGCCMAPITGPNLADGREVPLPRGVFLTELERLGYRFYEEQTVYPETGTAFDWKLEW